MGHGRESHCLADAMGWSTATAIGVSQTGLRYSKSDIRRSRATYIHTCYQVWYWYNFSYLAEGDHFLDLVVPPATFREGLRYAHL